MRWWIASLLLGMVVGCGKASHQSIVAQVDPQGWSRAARISVECSDTTSLRDITIFARTMSDIKRIETTMTINTIDPDGKSFGEAVSVSYNRDERSTALSGDVEIPYRTKVKLGKMGNYTIEITPSNEIVGISAIGVAICRSRDN